MIFAVLGVTRHNMRRNIFENHEKEIDELKLWGTEKKKKLSYNFHYEI